MKKREYRVTVNFVGRETCANQKVFEDAARVMLEWCEENQDKVLAWAKKNKIKLKAS